MAEKNTTITGTVNDTNPNEYQLEAFVIKTRDTMRVVALALYDAAEKETDERNASIVYGAAGILENVAAECERIFWAGAKK